MSVLILDVVTFKVLAAPENASAFSEILEAAGEIFTPELIGDNTKYSTEQLVRRWTKDPVLLLKRARPFKVDAVLLVNPERLVKGVLQATAMPFSPPIMPKHLFMAVDENYFRSATQLRELLQLGTRICNLLSPCYGFIRLPWMPELQATTCPERGLPGWGWATWLGPEYDDIVQLPSGNDIEVQSMAGGGKLIVLPYPSDPNVEDSACLAAYRHILDHIDPRVFQPAFRQQTGLSLPGHSGREYEQATTAHDYSETTILPRFRFLG